MNPSTSLDRLAGVFPSAGRSRRTLIAVLATCALSVATALAATPAMATGGSDDTPPPSSTPTDSCGYPTGSGKPATVFVENSVLRAITSQGAGVDTQISAWYSDEHAMTLGTNPNPSGSPVTPMPSTASPQHAVNPSVGDRSATDASGRPMFPAAFVTDISANPAAKSGDWQQLADNTSAQSPNDVFGTWKAATKSGTSVTPGPNPAANSSFGAFADTAPAGISWEGFRTEVRWNASAFNVAGAGLIPGHTYRVQVLVQDGDQKKTGGDAGEACINLTIPTAKLKVDKKVAVGAPAGTYVDGPANAHVGDTLYYKVTASNTGSSDLAVTTSDFSSSCGSGALYTTPASTTAVAMPQTITAGQSATYYCKHTLSAADVAAPNSDYLNKACAAGDYRGFPASGDPNAAALCDTVVVHVLDPKLKLEKTQSLKSDGTGFSAADISAHLGDKVIYRLIATNTGNTPVQATTLDPPAGQSGCDGPLRATIAPGPGAAQPATIAVGASATYYCDHTLGAADGSAFVNHACVSGTDSAGGAAAAKPGDSLCDTTTTKIAHPGFKVTKTVDKTRARIGDTLTYTITATNTGDVLLHVSNFDDHVKGSAAAGCTFAAGQAPAATFDIAAGASASFTCTHVVAASDPTPYSNVACFDATDGVGVTPATFAECGEGTTTPLDAVLKITKTVDKDHAYDGEKLSYTITVTNTGRATADDVQLTDVINGTNHGCAPLVGPAQGGSLAPGASITYACAYDAQHADEDSTHHIVNTATVTAKDPAGDPVAPQSASATTRIVHPAIKIEKTGPATGQAGDKIGYVLTVTNPGDEAFADATVKVTDAQCNGAPVELIGKGGDASPATLDPGDVWTYSCSVQTNVGDTAVHNTALVEGADEFGKVVNSSGTADTTLTQPAQLVLPSRIVPGTAKLEGPTGCAAKAFNARVRGTKIATVTFLLDGKVVKRFKKPLASGSYALRVNPAKLRLGVHRLVANVTFQSGTGTKPKTIRLSFQRCGKKLADPRFTG